MKILVFSDSHGSKETMIKVVKKIGKSVDMILHLGDLATDLPRTIIPEKIPIEYVRGNCDKTSEIPVTKSISVQEGRANVFMTHGHLYNVKYDSDKIVYAAFEQQADICVFGHTHSPAVFKEENTLFLNPGSISLPRGTKFPTYGILDIETKIRAAVVEVRPEGIYRIISDLS